MIEIATPEFKLKLNPKVYDSPSLHNMNLQADIVSTNFSVSTEIDTGSLQFNEFIDQLIKMYNSLKGSAELTGNDNQKIVFEATRTGKIIIKGNLGRCFTEEDYKVSFTVEVDQTDLSKSVRNIEKEI